MILIDLNMLAILISDLNSEINYKITEYVEGAIEEDTLTLMSNGQDYTIIFCGFTIWSSLQESELEPGLLPEIQIEEKLNERSKFEAHLRLLINDKINILKNLEL